MDSPDDATPGNGGRLIERLGRFEGGPAVILLPPIRGGMVGYTILINALRSTTNLFGLRYPPDLNALKPDMIEGLARLYAGAIQESAFSSGVVLMGWSMGALLAYEVARRLTVRGLRVRDVVLIDPHPMERSLENLIPDGFRERRTFFWTSYLSFKFHEDERRRVLDEGRFWDLSELERFESVARNDRGVTGPFREFARPMDPRSEFKFIGRSLAAMSRYTIRGYRGDCCILCCKQFESRTRAAWTDRLIPRRRMIVVDGDHNSIMLHHCIAPIKRLLFAPEVAATRHAVSEQVPA
jgi:pimeloyl-ACP methyl ester carboxylesterase